MKKIQVYLLMLLMIVFFSACNQENVAPDAALNETTVTTQDPTADEEGDEDGDYEDYEDEEDEDDDE